MPSLSPWLPSLLSSLGSLIILTRSWNSRRQWACFLFLTPMFLDQSESLSAYHLGRTPLILHPSHPSSSLMLLSLWAHPLLLEWLFSARWQMLLRAEKRGLLRVLGVNQPGPHGRGHGEVLKKLKMQLPHGSTFPLVKTQTKEMEVPVPCQRDSCSPA